MAETATLSRMDSALEAAGLTVRYPGQGYAEAALAGLSLTVTPGEKLLLLGPNGAGKSTCIRVFAGLLRPTAGEARVFGRPAAQARHLVGVVGHATYLYDELTAEENLRFYGDLYRVAEIRQRARWLLDAVGLLRLAGERVGRLSRGQQQRVALARALLHDPPLLLLDEPDTGLDPAAFQLLEELALRGPRTVVMTTHNLGAGLRLGTRAVVLARGRMAHEVSSLSAADVDALTGVLRRLATTPPGAA